MSLKMPINIILVLMVRNESKIIERCLEANSNHVDSILVVDTGSDDNTMELAKKYTSNVISDKWFDFGTNRTLSFNYAVVYAKKMGWNLNTSYSLMLDADMILRCRTDLRSEFNHIYRATKLSSYDLYQINSNVEYVNKRILRLDENWESKGVTHEYWRTTTDQYSSLCSVIDKDIAYIEDINDGGCKINKFERDLILLNTGLITEPDNSRYIFYKANTLRDMKSYTDAILWYKKRINMGGWDEEVWYSYYMISRCYLYLQNVVKCEKWAQKAFHYRPERIEPLMMLVKYFRESFNPNRAWHYLTIAGIVQKTTDILFVEKDAYDVEVDFEKSILWYYKYPNEKEAGLNHCINYLNSHDKLADVVISNLQYYAMPMPNVTWKQFNFPVSDDYISSSLSVSTDGMMNVRAVNYFINDDRGFLFDNKIDTKNYCTWYDPGTKEWFNFDELHTPSQLKRNNKINNHIITGLEDIRIYNKFFTANTLEFSYTNAIRVVVGKYPSMEDIRVLKPPTETKCEKNWILISNNKLIYKWHPLQIYSIPVDDDKIVLETVIDSPKWFSCVRGSTTPFKYQNQLWFIVHIVCMQDDGNRKYLHAWIVLDDNTYEVMGYSLPFTFHNEPIEYCTGAQLWNNTIHIFASFWDRESWVGTKSFEECKQDIIWIWNDDINLDLEYLE